MTKNVALGDHLNQSQRIPDQSILSVSKGKNSLQLIFQSKVPVVWYQPGQMATWDGGVFSC